MNNNNNNNNRIRGVQNQAELSDFEKKRKADQILKKAKEEKEKEKEKENNFEEDDVQFSKSLADLEELADNRAGKLEEELDYDEDLLKTMEETIAMSNSAISSLEDTYNITQDTLLELDRQGSQILQMLETVDTIENEQKKSE